MSVSHEPIRVLHVDDDAELLAVARHHLERENDAFAVETATSVDEALDCLREGAVDCVVSDYAMPGRDGLSFLETVRDIHGDLPFVLFTGKGSEEIASQAVAAGVTAYVPRGPDSFGLLARRIERAVANRRATTDLETAQARLDLALDGTDTGVWEWDVRTGRVFWNDAVARLVGTPVDEFEQHVDALEQHVDPVDRAGVERALERVLETDGTVRAEFRVADDDTRSTASGEAPTWIELRATAIRDDAGQTTRVVGVANDVTSRRERERRIAASAERLRTVLDNAPIVMFALDGDGVFTLSKGRGLDRLGLDPGEVVGESVFDVYADEPAVVADAERALDGERVNALREVGDHAFEVWYEPVVEDGAVDRVIGVAVDVTEQRRHERAVTRLHEATRELMRADSRSAIADVGVATARDVVGFPYSTCFLWDAADEVLRSAGNTDEARDRFGSPPTFERGQGIAGSVFATGEREVFDDAQADPRGHPDGSPNIRSYAVLPLEDHGVLTVVSDAVGALDGRRLELVEVLAANLVTAFDRLDREQALRERERALERQNDQLEAFAGVVSHDLRNPLAVARACVELAGEERGPSEHLDAADRALDRMAELVDDLLRLARESPVDATEPVGLREVAEAAWALAGTDAASLDVRTDATVIADHGRLQQLFENLFRNSVEHAGEDVSVAVEPILDHDSPGDGPGDGSSDDPAVGPGGDPADDPTDDPADDPADDAAVCGFAVVDDGPGIPAAGRDAVFESGYTTDRAGGGTGLGLSIVRDVAEAHGWTVAVAEGADGGARFEVTGVSTS